MTHFRSVYVHYNRKWIRISGIFTVYYLFTVVCFFLSHLFCWRLLIFIVPAFSGVFFVCMRICYRAKHGIVCRSNQSNFYIRNSSLITYVSYLIVLAESDINIMSKRVRKNTKHFDRSHNKNSNGIWVRVRCCSPDPYYGQFDSAIRSHLFSFVVLATFLSSVFLKKKCFFKTNQYLSRITKKKTKLNWLIGVLKLFYESDLTMSN